MKIIEVDEELYRYIASHTQHIGESASDILRRMLNFTASSEKSAENAESAQNVHIETKEAAVNDASIDLDELFESSEMLLQKKAVDRFILLLSALYSVNSNAFSDAAQSLHGRTRIYFARDEKTLLEHGKHTKPKAVPDTPYWVITNTNSARKRNMIVHIMQSMQFSDRLINKACDVI